MIVEETTSAQDCTIELTTAAFDGVLVNWDDITLGFQHNVSPFSPNSAGIRRYSTPTKEVPPLRIRVTLGGAQTLLDLKQAFDTQTVTNFVMTGWPSHSSMVAEYGTLGVVSVTETVGERAMGEVVLQYGLMKSGYTPV